MGIKIYAKLMTKVRSSSKCKETVEGEREDKRNKSKTPLLSLDTLTATTKDKLEEEGR